MSPRRRAPRSKQRGSLIIALMAGIAIVMILSTVAVQNWSDIVRRDNEAEMMFRAQDIVRALKRFQTDKGHLPTELKELMEPGQKGQYLLRRLWKDPLVKGGQWQFVYAAPGGGLFDPSVQPVPPEGGAQQGTSLGTALGTQPDGGGFPPIGSQVGPGGKAGVGGEPTGMPIAGVKTKCTDKAFRKYREKTEYSEWVFSVFDLEQQRQQQGGANLQNPTGQAAFPPQSPPQTPPPGTTQPPPAH
jgi:type II secretory pathway pseudopilin PulG